RFAAQVKERGGKVVVECHPRLAPLLAGVAGVDRLVPMGAQLPSFHTHVPLLRLPGILGITLDKVPAAVPYLRMETTSPAVDSLPRRSKAKEFLVGIVWQGNLAYRADRQRSIPLEQFRRLCDVPDVRLIGLQKGPGVEQLHVLGDEGGPGSI